MSLKEEIERRRAAQTAGVNTNNTTTNASSGNGVAASTPASEKHGPPAAPPPLFLRLVKRDKQCWLLPWASFHGVGYAPEAADAAGEDAGRCEHLRLVFMRHDVSVRGHNLGGVVDSIESLSLRELCESSEKFHAVAKAGDAPVVMALEIKVKTQ